MSEDSWAVAVDAQEATVSPAQVGLKGDFFQKVQKFQLAR